MKRLLSLVLLLALIASPAGFAVTDKIPVKTLKLVTTIPDPDDVAGIVVLGTTIVVYGTKVDKSFARAIDTSGQELWNVSLDPDSASIATAGAVDSGGNIWIAGSTSRLRASATPTPTATPLNPDGVVATPEVFSADLNAVALWKIPAGSTKPTLYSAQASSPVLITSIALDKTGISLVGYIESQRGSSGFVISANLLGEFGKSILVGRTSTTLDAVVRHSDGSLTVTGASGEKLGGKKLSGIIDGVIIKISKVGTVTSVVRSSAPKAKRNWTSATSSLLLGGEVMTGEKIESAVTKFSNSYAPVWTNRFSSTGPTFTVGSDYALFESTGKIPQVRGWAPNAARPLLLSFDGKGMITGAYSVPTDQNKVFGALYSRNLGLLCLTSNSEAISIFTFN